MLRYKISLLAVLFLLTLLFTGSGVYAQYENTSGKKQEGTVQKKKKQKPKEASKWFVGGMIGAGFSSYSSYIEVSPIVGYKITPSLHVGTRLTYIFNSYEINGQRENLNHYGASLFARYIIWKGLFAQVEYESLSFDQPEYERIWVNSLFLGGGYIQTIGGRGFMSFAILFNLLEDQYSPYSNPLIRIGFGVGF